MLVMFVCVVCVGIHIYTYTCMCVCVCLHVYTYMYICIYMIFMYIHICIYMIFMYIHICLCIYIYIHIYIIRANAHPDPLTRHQKSSHISLAKLCPLSASRLLCARRSSLNASSASRRNPIYILCMYVYICIYMCV